MLKELDPAYERFVGDLAGFLWRYKKATGKKWDHIRRDCNLAHDTVVRLADRKTRNPQGYTIWRILRTMDCSLDAFRHNKRMNLGRKRHG